MTAQIKPFTGKRIESRFCPHCGLQVQQSTLDKLTDDFYCPNCREERVSDFVALPPPPAHTSGGC